MIIDLGKIDTPVVTDEETARLAGEKVEQMLRERLREMGIEADTIEVRAAQGSNIPGSPCGW